MFGEEEEGVNRYEFLAILDHCFKYFVIWHLKIKILLGEIDI